MFKLPHLLIASPGVNAQGKPVSKPADHKLQLDNMVSRAFLPAGPVLPAAANPVSRPLELPAELRLGHEGSLAWGPLPGDLAPRAYKALAKRADELGFDLALIPAGEEFNDFAVLAMDMDSTVITIECVDELADFAGKKKEVSEITEATMRGEIADFKESLRRRVALLEGVPEGAVQAIIDQSLRFSPGARELVAGARAAGLKTLLVSGGFTVFTRYVAEALGFDQVRSNTLEVVDGRLTGRLLGDIVDGEAKKQAVEALCAELGVSTSQAIVVGDGSNDLPMMEISGLSVAYKAKPAVRARAMRAINHGRLDSLLLGWQQELAGSPIPSRLPTTA